MHDHSCELDLLRSKQLSLPEDSDFNEETLLIAPVEMWFLVVPDSPLIRSPVCSPEYVT